MSDQGDILAARDEALRQVEYLERELRRRDAEMVEWKMRFIRRPFGLRIEVVPVTLGLALLIIGITALTSLLEISLVDLALPGGAAAVGLGLRLLWNAFDGDETSGLPLGGGSPVREYSEYQRLESPAGGVETSFGPSPYGFKWKG